MRRPISEEEMAFIKNTFRYEDGELIRKRRCGNNGPVGCRAGYVTANGYRAVRVIDRSIFEHRVIWALHNGRETEGYYIDHINRVRDDNRIENLRLVTKSQNGMNQSIQARSKTGFKGVYKREGRPFWQMTIAFSGRTHHLGHYHTAAEAAQAYNIIAARVYGQYAALNNLEV